MSEALAEIDYDDVLVRTKAAILFLIERGEGDDPDVQHWIPMSQIEDYTGDLLDTEEVNTGPGSILIPQWLAEEKGLV